MNPESQSPNPIRFNSTFWILTGLTILFLFTRLTKLTFLPIFNDEAVYINWARMIKDGEAGLFISILADNKKPLQIWFTVLNWSMLDDPLAAGRSASVLGGWVCLLGIYFTGRRLFSGLGGILVAWAYIFCPYTLLFDRLAHESSWLNAAMVWNLWLTVGLVQRDQIQAKHFMALILTVGAGLLTLSTALLFIFIPLLFKIIHIQDKTFASWKFFGVGFLTGLLAAALPYGVLLLNVENYKITNVILPSTHALGQSGNLELIMGIPFNIWNGLTGVLQYFWVYFTPPIFLSSLVGLLLIGWKGDRKHLTILIYFFIPTLILLGTAGSGFSRYYVFCTTPLLLGVAFLLDKIWTRIEKWDFILNPKLSFFFLIAIGYLPSIVSDYSLIFKPKNGTYIERDRYQFVTSQYSGYGVPDALDYLREEAETKKIAVFTSTNWGNPSDAVYAYLTGHPNIEIYSSYWVFNQPLLPSHIKSIDVHQRFTGKFLEQLKTSDLPDVYFIRRTSPGFKRGLFIRVNPNLSLERVFKKPDSTFFIEVYRLRK